MITSSPNRIEQNQILYNCLRPRCTKEALMTVCKMIIAVRSNPQMKDLGEDMKRMLERKCCVCSSACMTWCACTPQTTSSLSNFTTLVSLTTWLSTKNIHPQCLVFFLLSVRQNDHHAYLLVAMLFSWQCASFKQWWNQVATKPEMSSVSPTRSFWLGSHLSSSPSCLHFGADMKRMLEAKCCVCSCVCVFICMHDLVCMHTPNYIITIQFHNSSEPDDMALH